jgi:hypothetical protein
MSMRQITPAIHKPTSTLLIDDDHLFIDNIRALLPDNRNCHVVSAQSLAMAYGPHLFSLQDGKSFIPLTTSDVLDRNSFLPIPVSVIVIDHCMAPHNGIDILRRITSPFIQKILISNFFTNNDAIDAFNQNIINHYICKMDPLFIDKLNSAISDAKQNFFIKISSMLPDFFSEENLLFEPKIKDIFYKIKSDHNVDYYFSSDDLKQFEFFDKNGENRVSLNIIPEDELNDILNSYHAESASSEIISLIKSGVVLPYGSKDCFPEGKDWLTNLKSAQSFEGKKKYFYTICETKKHAAIESNI